MFFMQVESLKRDENFLIEAIKKHHQVIYYIESVMWEKKSFIEKVLRYNIECLRFLKQESRNDLEMLSLATQLKPNSLQYCSVEIRNNKDFVMKCLGKQYTTMMFVGESLLDDIDILRKCLFKSKSLMTLKYSMNEKDLMREIVKRYPVSILRFYKYLKDEFEFELKTISMLMFTKTGATHLRSKYYNLERNFYEYIEDIEMAQKFIREFHSSIYENFCTRVREDKETLKLAISVKSPIASITRIPEKLHSDRDLLVWMANNGNLNWQVERMMNENFPDDPEFLNIFLNKYFISSEKQCYLSCYLQSNEVLCRLAMEINPSNLFKFSHKFRKTLFLKYVVSRK